MELSWGPPGIQISENTWFLYGFCAIFAHSPFSFQDRPRQHHRASGTLKRAQGEPIRDPREVQEGPQRGPRGAKRGPKRAPRGHSEPTWLGDPSGTPPGPLRGPILGPNWGPKRIQDEHFTCSGRVFREARGIHVRKESVAKAGFGAERRVE